MTGMDQEPTPNDRDETLRDAGSRLDRNIERGIDYEGTFRDEVSLEDGRMLRIEVDESWTGEVAWYELTTVLYGDKKNEHTLSWTIISKNKEISGARFSDIVDAQAVDAGVNLSGSMTIDHAARASELVDLYFAARQRIADEKEKQRVDNLRSNLAKEIADIALQGRTYRHHLAMLVRDISRNKEKIGLATDIVALNDEDLVTILMSYAKDYNLHPNMVKRNFEEVTDEMREIAQSGIDASNVEAPVSNPQT